MGSVSTTTPKPTFDRHCVGHTGRGGASKTMNAPQPARKPLMALDAALADLLSRATPLAATETLATVLGDGRVLA